MIDTKYLSEHFQPHEATDSTIALRLGIDNTQVTQEVWAAAQRTATGMEKVRTILGYAIHIDSWIRCKALNDAVGSKDTSQHLKGEAVDFVCPSFGTPLDIARELIKHKDLIRFDQLIMEHTWVHISWCAPTVQPRGQVLSLIKGGHYAPGLTTIDGVPYDS